MKKRTRHLPRPDKTIREWEDDKWTYELAQKASGKYVCYAVETEGDGWRIESGDTIKGTLAAVRQTDAEVACLLAVAEAD